MNLKIEIGTNTVHGTDKGGEDLFFTVKATCDEEPTLVALSRAFDASYGVALKEFVGDGLEDAEASDKPFFRATTSRRPMGKAISRRMRDHLAWCVAVVGSDGRIQLGRPTHHENRVTHDALVRRGLLREEADGTTTVTPEGKEAAKAG